MSASNYDGVGDADHVAERLDELTTPERPSAAEAEQHFEFEDTREHVETAETPETVMVDINGETVPLDPPPSGVGRYRPLTDVIRADERGQDDKQLLAVMDMTDCFIEASPDAYSQRFWDALDEQAVINTYGQWLREATAGNA